MSEEKIQLFGDCTLDLGRGTLLRNDVPVHLRRQAYEVLVRLVRAQGRLVGKNQLIEEIWEGRAVTDGALAKCVEEIRQALGPESSFRLRTVHGRGYLLERDAAPLPDESTESGPAPADRLPPRSRVFRKLVIPAVLSLVVLGLLYNWSGGLVWRRPAARVDQLDSIAVLPFKPLIPSVRNEALEMGMADTLIARLSGLGDLIVRPISASRRYSDLEGDPVRAGRELAVDAVLDGSIQRDGDRMRVTARLIRVEDGKQLWSDRFDEGFRDIFSVQDSISEKVVGQLAVKLSGDPQASASKRGAVNPEAFENYLWGRYYWNKATFDDYRKSLGYFQRAVELDPSFGPAYAGIADYYGFGVSSGALSPDQHWPLMEKATLKALELDPRMAEAHNSLAGLRLYCYRDWKGGLEAFQRAVELNPGYAEAHNHLGTFSWLLKWEDRCIAEFKHVLQLDPFSVRYNRNLARTLYVLGRDEESLEQFHKTLRLDPNDTLSYEFLSLIHERRGREDAAAAALKQALMLEGDREMASILETELRGSGYNAAVRAVARRQVERLQDRLSKGEYVAAMHFVRAYARTGDNALALSWLERAYQERNRLVLEILVDPVFDQLRSEPGFQEVVARLNLDSDALKAVLNHPMTLPNRPSR